MSLYIALLNLLAQRTLKYHLWFPHFTLEYNDNESSQELFVKTWFQIQEINNSLCF